MFVFEIARNWLPKKKHRFLVRWPITVAYCKGTEYHLWISNESCSALALWNYDLGKWCSVCFMSAFNYWKPTLLCIISCLVLNFDKGIGHNDKSMRSYWVSSFQLNHILLASNNFKSRQYLINYNPIPHLKN